MSEEQENNVTEEVKTEEAVRDFQLWGKTIKGLPADEVEELIKLRDEKINGFKEVSSKLDRIEAAKAEEERARIEAENKAKALEAAKEGDIEKAKEILSQEYQKELEMHRKHSFLSAVKAAVGSRKDLVDGALDDVTANLVNSNEWKLTEDFKVVNAEGKTVDEVANSFIDSRPYLKLAESRTPVKPGGQSGEPKTQQRASFAEVSDKLYAKLNK